MLDRRSFIHRSASLTLLAPFASIAANIPDPEARFVLVILRGGLDGLAAVPPYGEPRYRSLRGEIALDAPGSEGGTLKLDGLFGLHPALSNMHALYEAKELSVVHAVATPYRERSHFDGQKVLEAGGLNPSTSSGGWLNRALTELTRSGRKREAIALAANLPLVLRGSFPVTSWAPSRLPESEDDTLARVRALYEAVDPGIGERLGAALDARGIGGDLERGMARRRGQALNPLVAAAARFLSSDEGPRIAVMEVGGWDTHANQGAAQGQLATRLGALDGGLKTLKTELGHHWNSTAVMIVTEFGRTVAVNGTRGTDHGTAGCAFVAGGAVDGGRIFADWPGLGAGDLREGRDLRPTLDLRAACKGILAGQFGLDEATLEERVFPDSETASALALLHA